MRWGSSGLDTPYCNHYRVKLVKATCDQGLQRLNHFARDWNRIVSVVRHRAVTTAPHNPHYHPIRAGENRSGFTVDNAARGIGVNVQRKRTVGAPTCFENALVDHRLRAARSLFTRLKHKSHVTCERFAALGKHVSGPHQHCRMRVVTTGVHAPGDFRCKGQPGIFRHR